MTCRSLCRVLVVITMGVTCSYGARASATATFRTSTVIDPARHPSTERVVVARDGRVFIAAGNAIWEVVTQPDGSHRTKMLARGTDCVFSGLAARDNLLYGACTASSSSGLPASSDLVRIDLLRSASDPKKIVSAPLGDTMLFPNGMAVDDRGDIYVTNSFSAIFQLMSLFTLETIPALVRVRVTDQDPFTIQRQMVLPAALAGLAPNGIQISGDRLWFVSSNLLYQAEIGHLGLKNLTIVYQNAVNRMFDDFAVLPGNVVAITEFPTIPLLLSLLFPDAPPSLDPSQLLFVSTGPGPYAVLAGQVVHRHFFELGIIPSSAVAVDDAEGSALYVTDFFSGGLYRVPLLTP